MQISEVLEKLNEKEALEDTMYSKNIFNVEEGKQDELLKSGRRDWLILADIYNEGKHTQKFHLKNYLDFKLADGLNTEDDFNARCFRYINNGALRLYIMEVIYCEDNDEIKKYYRTLFDYYLAGKPINKCPRWANS